MKERGWNQKEIAEELGVAQSAVSLWLAGKRLPSYEILVRASRVFNLHFPAAVKPLGAVHETPKSYAADRRMVWLNNLKRHWHRKGAPQDHIALAIQMIFTEDAAAIIKWLEED